MLECCICGQQLRSISNTHLRKHNITPAEYAQQYSSSLISSETRAKQSKFKGDWNTLPLGQQPDTAIARQLSVDRQVVEKARRARNIPAFTGLILTQEDVACRSIYEAMYDAYLHWQQIEHQHEVRVEGLPYICDFYVDGQYIEIAGMIHFKKYAEKHKQKRQAYQNAGVNAVWLLPDEIEKLYSDCPVQLKFRAQRRCSDCGKETHDLVKGVCRVCYIRRWHKVGEHKLVCPQCGKTFTSNGSESKKFCSHVCYAQSLELDWPSWEEIDHLLQTTSIRQVAFKLGVKPTALYMRLRRRKQRAVEVGSM